MGKGSRRRSCLVSREEEEFRWKYYKGELKITEKEFLQYVKEIRKRKETKR